jgi:hypothetical protein
MLNGKNSKSICYFDLLTVCHCEERGKKSGGQSSFSRLKFLPAFLPPEEKIPSLTNEPKKNRMTKDGT